MVYEVSSASVQNWAREDKNSTKSGNYLELGHVHLSKRKVLFAQFSPVFLEVKTQNGVKDQILAIYVLSLVPNDVDQKISPALPWVSGF